MMMINGRKKKKYVQRVVITSAGCKDQRCAFARVKILETLTAQKCRTRIKSNRSQSENRIPRPSSSKISKHNNKNKREKKSINHRQHLL